MLAHVRDVVDRCTGQHGCTAVVTSNGKLYTCGHNFHGRLGHGEVRGQRWGGLEGNKGPKEEIKLVSDIEWQKTKRRLHKIMRKSAKREQAKMVKQHETGWPQFGLVTSRVEQFGRFRFLVQTVPLQKGGFLCVSVPFGKKVPFRFQFLEKTVLTVLVPLSVPGRTVPTVPVQVLFLGLPDENDQMYEPGCPNGIFWTFVVVLLGSFRGLAKYTKEQAWELSLGSQCF